MRSWNRPAVPRLGGIPVATSLWDSASGAIQVSLPSDGATLYVCGITPYDATHIGHAATYLAYDTLVRLWLDAGIDVRYVQNATDVDDPLLERATAIGVDWRALAAAQLDVYRRDMEALGVIPPDEYVAVTDAIPIIATAVGRLLAAGFAYPVGEDVYFDSAAAARLSPWHLGEVSRLGRDDMLRLSAERGGDPHRAGKRDPLDPVLWLAARAGEPSWPGGTLGEGRPGWHIECSAIAGEYLGTPVTVAGGGHDLLFPHHEFTAGQTAALTSEEHAHLYSHAGLVAYRGEKMSKSLGNLVFVSRLIDEGVDARAIRLAILAHHYRQDWEWTDAVLADAEDRLRRWRRWATGSPDAGSDLAAVLRGHLARDLDTPAALTAVDARAASGAASRDDLDAVHALLGVDLTRPVE